VRVRLVAAAMVAVLVPTSVLAAPATVKVFEAQARSAPSPDAPAAHVFPEGAAVSVSEEAEAGWRRIRLPDGTAAWVEDGAVALAGEPEVVVPAPAALPVPPDLTPRVYVKDLNHLAVLVSRDSVVGPQARRLEDRRRAAIATGVVGLGVSLGLVVTGLVQTNQEFDRAFDSPEMERPGHDGTGLLLTGVAFGAITPIVMWAILPKRGDLLDVINSWNARNPGEQFELGATELHRGHGHAR
jgi:hypothetical protein